MKRDGRRTDGWTDADDNKLASIVLEHIRTGGTQLRAFDEAARVLGRTPGACGFRWNAVLRKVHSEEMNRTKVERKGTMRKEASPETVVNVTPSLMMQVVMNWLAKYDREYQQLRASFSELVQERDRLAERVRFMETRSTNVNSTVKAEQLASDAEILVKIIERAKRQMDVG